MKAFVIVVLIVVVAVAVMGWAGWLTFSQSPDRATINIDKREIKEDSDQLLRKGKELTDVAGKKTRDLIKDTKD